MGCRPTALVTAETLQMVNTPDPETWDRLLQAMNLNTAATVAASLIAASHRPHSPNEAATLVRTCMAALFPQSSSPHFRSAAETIAVDQRHT